MDQSFMKTRKIFPLLMSMALPNMLSMLINSLYNIVDSFFVARISENAMSAVSIVFPIQNLSLSLAVGMGLPPLTISLLRYTVLIIPAAWLLSRFLGASGVFHAFWVTELLSAAAAALTYRRAFQEKIRRTGGKSA